MHRAARLIFSFCFLAVLFGVTLLTVFIHREPLLYYEQRSVAPIPSPTFETLCSGEITKDFERAVSDRIAGRTTLIRSNLKLELLLGRPVVSELAVGSDVLLAFHGYARWDTAYLTDEAKEAADAYQAFQAEINAYGGYFCYFGLPLQSTYFHEHYPDYMDSRYWHTQAIRAAFTAATEKAGGSFLDGHSVYEALGRPASYYARTDHHYTYEGAFVAYQALMERIKTDTGFPLAVLQTEDVDFITLPNPYLGSSDRKLYGLWGGGEDRLDIGVLREEIPFARTNDGVDVPSMLYNLPQTETETVTYDLYMGGDFGETVISTNRPELPTLLIFGDSFTNPLETLLWASFDQTRALDMRYYTEETLREYVARHQPDIVICVRDETTYLSLEGNGAVGQ